MLVRDFQSVIGREARAQSLAQFGKLPDAWWPVSAAAPTPWALSSVLQDEALRCMALRQGARVSKPVSTQPRCRSAVRAYSTVTAPILCRTMTDKSLNPLGVGWTRLSRCRAEHAWLKDIGRVQYVAANDDEALQPFID